jgi:tetratricopeptide (TPR) repeat protein
VFVHFHFFMKNILYLILLLHVTDSLQSQSLQNGIRLFEAKQLDEAYKEFSSIDQNSPDYAESLYYLGRISAGRNKLQDSQNYLEKAVKQAPNRADFHLFLGMVYSQRAMQSNPVSQALLAGKIRSTFLKVAELDQSNVQARWILLGFYLRAPRAMGGDVNKARTMANELRRINPSEGSRAWGMIYQTENKNEEAERSYKKALELAPDSINNYLMLGSFYQTTEGFRQAFHVYESALERFPGNRNILFQIGRTSSISGDYPEKGLLALRSYLEAAPDRTSPSLAAAWYHMGQIEEKRGKNAEAKRNYQQALALNPDHKPSREALANL